MIQTHKCKKQNTNTNIHMYFFLLSSQILQAPNIKHQTSFYKKMEERKKEKRKRREEEEEADGVAEDLVEEVVVVGIILPALPALPPVKPM